MSKRKSECDLAEDLNDLMRELDVKNENTDDDGSDFPEDQTPEKPLQVSIEDYSSENDSQNPKTSANRKLPPIKELIRKYDSLGVQVDSDEDRLVINESPPSHSDGFSLQISSESSNEIFSLTTLDDSLSSYLVRTPGRRHQQQDASKSSHKESDFSAGTLFFL